MCVATNLENGKVKIFEKGDLVNSIMASSAYPSLINPVKINDSLYIDGAMTVNFPSKPLKDKGMDIVIGVDLTLPLANKDELNSAIKILDQVIDFTIQNENKTQYKNTDIRIHPNLKGYSSTSYGDKEKILNLGYEEAKKYIDILNKLPKRDSLPKMMSKPVYANVYKVDSLVLVNSRIFNESYVKGKMNLKIPSLQTYAGINQMIDKLYATNNYKLINYDLMQHQGKNILITSQTKKALRVLKDKIPKNIQGLCISILDDDNSDMRKSVESISEKMGYFTSDKLKKEV